MNSKTDNKNDTNTLWPSENYQHYVEQLKSIVGKKIYLIELKPTEINMGIEHTDKAYELLAVIDFPKPDPEKGLYPHCLLLDDGRGINLGRIARITTGSAFNPTEKNIIYQESELLEEIVFRDRQLSHESVAHCSKQLLGNILGKQTEEPGKKLEDPDKQTLPHSDDSYSD